MGLTQTITGKQKGPCLDEEEILQKWNVVTKCSRGKNHYNHLWMCQRKSRREIRIAPMSNSVTLILNFLKAYLLDLIIFMCLVLHGCVCTMYVQGPRRQEERVRSPGTRGTWELPCGYWKQSRGHLEEQPMLLTPELPLHPRLSLKFYKNGVAISNDIGFLSSHKSL